MSLPTQTERPKPSSNHSSTYPHPDDVIHSKAWFKSKLAEDGMDAVCDSFYGVFPNEIDRLKISTLSHTYLHPGLANVPLSDSIFLWGGVIKYFPDSTSEQLAMLYKRLPRRNDGEVDQEQWKSGKSKWSNAIMLRSEVGKFGLYAASVNNATAKRGNLFRTRLVWEGFESVVQPLESLYPDAIARLRSRVASETAIGGDKAPTGKDLVSGLAAEEQASSMTTNAINFDTGTIGMALALLTSYPPTTKSNTTQGRRDGYTNLKSASLNPNDAAVVFVQPYHKFTNTQLLPLPTSDSACKKPGQFSRVSGEGSMAVELRMESSDNQAENTEAALHRVSRQRRPIQFHDGTVFLPISIKTRKACKRVDHTYKDQPDDQLSPAPSPFLRKPSNRKIVDATYKDQPDDQSSPAPSPILRKSSKRKIVDATYKDQADDQLSPAPSPILRRSKKRKIVDTTYKDQPDDQTSPAPSPLLRKPSKRKIVDTTYKEQPDDQLSPAPSPILRKSRKRKTLDTTYRDNPELSDSPDLSPPLKRLRKQARLEATNGVPTTEAPSDIASGKHKEEAEDSSWSVPSLSTQAQQAVVPKAYPSEAQIRSMRFRSLVRGLKLQTDFGMRQLPCKTVSPTTAVPSIEKSTGISQSGESGITKSKASKTVSWAAKVGVRVFHRMERLQPWKLARSLQQEGGKNVNYRYVKRSWSAPDPASAVRRNARSRGVSPEPGLLDRNRELIDAR